MSNIKTKTMLARYILPMLLILGIGALIFSFQASRVYAEPQGCYAMVTTAGVDTLQYTKVSCAQLEKVKSPLGNGCYVLNASSQGAAVSEADCAMIESHLTKTGGSCIGLEGKDLENCKANRAGSASHIQTPVDDAAESCSVLNSGGSCDFLGYINSFIKFLASLVGIIVTIMIIIGGIQYTQSAGDPSKVAAAKKRIYNAIFALVAFGLLYAVLQWLLPGGALGG